MVLRRNRDKAGSTRKLNFKMIINGFRSKTGKSENKEDRSIKITYIETQREKGRKTNKQNRALKCCGTILNSLTSM